MSSKLLRQALNRAIYQCSRRQDTDGHILVSHLPTKSNEIEQTTFKKGDAAPYAYNDVYDYPEDYKPWSFNYKGDGLLIASLIGIGYSYYSYEQLYLQKTGRLERQKDKKYYSI